MRSCNLRQYCLCALAIRSKTMAVYFDRCTKGFLQVWAKESVTDVHIHGIDVMSRLGMFSNYISGTTTFGHQHFLDANLFDFYKLWKINPNSKKSEIYRNGKFLWFWNHQLIFFSITYIAIVGKNATLIFAFMNM